MQGQAGDSKNSFLQPCRCPKLMNMPAAVSDSKHAPLRGWRRLCASPLAWATGFTLVALLWLDGFFTFGRMIPQTIDINPAMTHLLRFTFPPQGYFYTDYWLGQTQYPASLQPLSLLAWLPAWMFYSGVYPLFTALAIPAAWLFLRELGFGRSASLAAAIFYAWQGEIFSTLLAGHFPAPIMWALLPLSAWLVLLCSRRDSFFLASAAGVGIGLQVALLPDRGMLCSVLLAGFFLVEAWLCRREGWAKLGRLAARLAAVVVMAALISFPDLSSTLESLVYQVQGEEIAELAPEDDSRSYDWATQWSWTPEEAMTYLVPGVLGWYQSSETGPYWGRVGRSAEFEETGEGMRNHRLAIFTWGTLAVPLFLLGLVRLLTRWGKLPELPGRLRAYLWFLLVAGVIGYLLALGKYTPLYALFYELPGMDTWRNPLKFLMPVSLSILVLVAAGADFARRVMDGEGKLKAQCLLYLFLLMSAGLLLFLLGSLVGIGGVDRGLLASGFTPEEVAAVFSNLRKSLLIAMAVSALAALACWWLTRPVRHDWLARWCVNPWLRRGVLLAKRPGWQGAAFLAVLAVLNVLQMLWAHSHFVKLFPTRDLVESNILIDKLKPEGSDRYRIKILRGDPVLESLLQRGFRYHGVESIDIPAVSRMPGDYRALFQALGGNVPRFLDLSSTKYYVLPGQAIDGLLRQPEFAQKAVALELFPVSAPLPGGKPSHAVLEMKGALPRASLVPQLQVLPNNKMLLAQLSNPDWDPRRNLLVDRDTAREYGLEETQTPPNAGLPPVAIRSYDGRRIVLETDAPVPAYLLLTDRHDPAWQVTVNGEPARAFPADFILRGVKIPAGKAEVVMTFHPRAWPVYLQLAAWLGFLLAGLLWWRSVRGQGVLAPPA